MKPLLLASLLAVLTSPALAIDFNCSPKPICLKKQAAAERAEAQAAEVQKVQDCVALSKEFFVKDQDYRNAQGPAMLNCVLENMDPTAKAKLRFQ